MGLLQLIAVILVIMWIGGFSLNIAGSFIHLLLVLAIALFVIRFFQRAV
jgi:hypothetical protein